MKTHSKPICKSHRRHTNQNLQIRLLLQPALTICFILLSQFLFSQNSKTDSLLSLLKTDKEDTNKVIHLLKLAHLYSYQNLDSAIFYAKKAKQISEKINNKKHIANALGQLGVYNFLKGDYPQALKYYFDALKINESFQDKKGIAATLGSIGDVYNVRADYPKALDYYYRALKTFEELGNKNGTATALGHIGMIYTDQADYPKALDYNFRALKINEELGDKNGIAAALGNIGIVYMRQADYPRSLDYYFRALKVFEELGNKNSVAASLGNIGLVYFEQADYPKALDYYFRALKMKEELGAKNLIATTLGNIGSLYTKTGKFKEAEDYLKRSLALCDTLGILDITKQFEEALSQLYDTTGRHQLAFAHYKKYITARDSIANDEQQKKQMRSEANFEFEKKEAVFKEQQEKERAIAEEKNRKQQIITLSVGAGLLLVILFAAFIFRSLRITKKQKFIIEIQRNEVTKQKEIVEKQKHLVEEHQKEIIDSITYAKRLQYAILPPTELIKKYFQNSFVLYKPKDIVAGDFYWMEVIDDIVFIAAADCTGHGVPGAMVSVVCSNALNRTVKEFNLYDTGKILDKVTDLVLETFEKSGEQIMDGMDISLLAYNMTSKQIQWSGANNPLWYIQNGQLTEIKADKQPVGKFDKRRLFTKHSIEHSDNLTFYLFTDGLPDQFGGPNGKKFMYKRFENNLADICKLPMDEQQTILEKAFADWKGELEQVDDVTVIGIKI